MGFRHINFINCPWPTAQTLFRNKRFELDEIFKQKASKSTLFQVKETTCTYGFLFHKILQILKRYIIHIIEYKTIVFEEWQAHIHVIIF